MPDKTPRQPTNRGPIQVLPAGLLGLFQLKTGGENPRNLASELAGIYKLDKHYWASNYEYAVQTVAVNAVGGFGGATPIAVGADEFWLLHGAEIGTDILAAGEAITFTGPRYLLENLGPAIIDSHQEVTVAAGQLGVLGRCYPDPLVLPPRTHIQGVVKAITVQADMSLRAWFTRCPI